MWNIRKNMEGNRRRKGKMKGWGEWLSMVIGIKEGTDCMEHWVLYANNESWNTTSKTMYCMVTIVTQ